MDSEEFQPFRLVGGTAMSLQLGHRESVDIDIFTDAPYRSIDFGRIDTFLRSKFAYVSTSNDNIVGMGKPYFVGESKKESIKLDIFYTDEYIQDPVVIDGIRMASIEEIIAMKIDVISRTGRKKDFWDIHELKDKYTLKQMLELHMKRHEYTHNADLIKMKLEDFSKADLDNDPVCLKNKKWGLIKFDISDFAWTESCPIVKKQHLNISLEANVSYRLYVKEGIDYFNTLPHFRYNSDFLGKQIMLNLKNNAGQMYSTPMHFDKEGQTYHSFIGTLTDSIKDYTFYYIEIISQEDVKFEFWLEDQEGGFMPF